MNNGGYMRSVRLGGYDKQQTLQVIDSLNMRIYRLETAIMNKKNGEPYSVPPATAFPPLRTVSLGGFNKSDVDAYINDLHNKIRELESKLAE